MEKFQLGNSCLVLGHCNNLLSVEVHFRCEFDIVVYKLTKLHQEVGMISICGWKCMVMDVVIEFTCCG